MKNLKIPKIMGQEILKEIKRNKVLLLQDKFFPNIVNLITKEEIKGSWWGHPLANLIYNGLNWLEDNGGILCLKFLSGKVTYIDSSLQPYFYTIVKEKRDWQIKGLTKDDLKLLKVIEVHSIRSDDSAYKTDSVKKSLERLEKRLLIYAHEEHTDSGKHIKIYKKWEISKKIKTVSYEEALAKFELLVHRMNEYSNSKVKLPWE